MAAQLYCTGPAFIYVSAPISSFDVPATQFFYLGTCEEAPEIELGPAWEPVLNDVTGKRKPIDMMFQGEDAVITAVLNRYDENVYANCIARRTNYSATRGSSDPLAIGTLALTEYTALSVAVVFPYAAKQAMIANGMPFGYQFYAAVPMEPEKLTVGTQIKKVGLHFYCWSVYIPTFGTRLYTTELSPGLSPLT